MIFSLNRIKLFLNQMNRCINSLQDCVAHIYCFLRYHSHSINYLKMIDCILKGISPS